MEQAPPGEITQILRDMAGGLKEDQERLWQLLYSALHARAARLVAGRDDTLGPTALVHEVFLKLQDTRTVQDRNHFLALASRAMRHILIDAARRRRPQGAQVEPDHLPSRSFQVNPGILAVHQALEQLQELEPRLVQVVECRYFGGLSAQETAEALGVSLRTVERDWLRARLFLRHALAWSDEA